MLLPTGNGSCKRKQSHYGISKSLALRVGVWNFLAGGMNAYLPNRRRPGTCPS